MRVNEAKTKYKIASKGSHTRLTIGQNKLIGDKNFEVIDEFVYLSALVRRDNDISLEIKRRIFAANKISFCPNRKIFHVKINTLCTGHLLNLLCCMVANHG